MVSSDGQDPVLALPGLATTRRGTWQEGLTFPGLLHIRKGLSSSHTGLVEMEGPCSLLSLLRHPRPWRTGGCQRHPLPELLQCPRCCAHLLFFAPSELHRAESATPGPGTSGTLGGILRPGWGEALGDSSHVVALPVSSRIQPSSVPGMGHSQHLGSRYDPIYDRTIKGLRRTRETVQGFRCLPCMLSTLVLPITLCMTPQVTSKSLS